MLAVLKLEAIGDHYFAYCKYKKRINPKYERHVWQMTKRGMRPWVARITGFDDHYEFAREFVNGQKDWSQANGIGSRGVYIYYPLRPGIYEVNDRVSWQRSRRYFIQVDGLEITEITREEVGEWLTNTNAI